MKISERTPGHSRDRCVTYLMIRFSIIILFLIIFSCAPETKKSPEYFIETKTSFFDLRHGDLTKNQWIRSSENLKVIHESLKKFGYQNLEIDTFPNDNLFLIHGIYIKRNFKNLVDSLLISYKNPVDEKYYKEFWERRKKEKNDSIVYEIIAEIQAVLFKGKQIEYDQKFVNDTLVDLINIEFGNDKITAIQAMQDFEVLRNYGFHQSAYNMLYERSEYSDLELKRDQMKNQLTRSSEFIYPWLIDNEK
ncbi:hypothetical protein [Muriicola jejuensis]|uniref:Uncharacterized protein n=1 Tax=Muriicola jejuensis TaxID=504488 RepID=A0A6P0UH56_9FLAO|nr:hypothetical protein [Muriicola jejuensis]NER11800.1 hypothetical protein [Muriicola jejuensis]